MKPKKWWTDDARLLSLGMAVAIMGWAIFWGSLLVSLP